MTALTTAPHNSGANFAADDTFSWPAYDTPEEILTEFIAPFLLITIIVQIGIEKALTDVLTDRNQMPQQRREDKKQIRKYATVLSLTIAGITIPTQLFEFLGGYVTALFGSVVFIFLGIIVVGFLLRVLGGG